MALAKKPAEIVAESKSALLAKHESWKRVNVSEVAEILNGFAFKSSKFTNDKGTPLIRIRDVGKDETKTYFDGDYDDAYLVRKGDLLIGMDGDFRCSIWRGEDALLNQRVCKITLKTDSYDFGFLSYVLQPYLDAIHAETSAVTVKHLSSRSISEIPLPLPPLEQQKRIVAKIEELFSHIDAGIEALNKAKQLLKQYRQSVLKAAVTGELTKEWREQNEEARSVEWLERIAVIRSGIIKKKIIPKSKQTAEIKREDIEYKLPKGWKWCRLDDFVLASVDCPHSTPKYKNEGKKCVRTADFLPGKLVADNIRYVTEESFDERNKRLVPKPFDVLYSREGGILGVACMIPDGEEMCLGQRMVIFRAESKEASIYLMHCLNSPLIVNKIKGLIGGSAAPHLNVGEIRNFLLPIPPQKEVKEILIRLDRKVEAIDRLESEMDIHLVKVEKNKQSILASAFSGRLQ